MSVNVTNVKVLDNPASFADNFKFEITFDCIAPGVKEELEWKLIYVGSADKAEHDQELDSVLVGPIAIGKNRFVFEAPPPDHTKIPENDLLDITVILLTCSYKDQEFIRVGYYTNNELMDELPENAPKPNTFDPRKIRRNILADKPRVTRFQIKWDGDEQMNENMQNNNNNKNNNNQSIENHNQNNTHSHDNENKENIENNQNINANLNSNNGNKDEDVDMEG